MGYKTRPNYDVYVHPTAGVGDYTSIATALSTEGVGASIYVSGGTYSESADILPLDEQEVTMGDGITINMATGKKLKFANGVDGARIKGRFTITGDSARLIHFEAGSSNCEIDVIANTTNSPIVSYFYVTQLDGDDHRIKLEIDEDSLTGGGSNPIDACAVISSSLVNSRVDLNIKNFSLSDNATSNLYGWLLFSTGNDSNVLNVNINNVTTANSVGRGLTIGAGSNSNSVTGTILGCNTNYSDSATGTADGGLAT